MSLASYFRHHTQETTQLQRKLPNGLQLFPYKGTHLFHALAIDTQIAVADAGSGTEVDGLGLVVEQKLDIVNEAKQQAGGLVVEVGLLFLNELGAWQ
jgi:hypothetical protein